MTKTTIYILLFFIYSNHIYSQEDSVAVKYHPKLSLYLMPFSLADPYYPTFRIGVDYLLYKNLKTDLDIQFRSISLFNTKFILQEFYGARFQIKYSMNTKSTLKREFRFNIGLESYYNYSTVLCNDHFYYDEDNYSRIVYYEEANYTREKYGINIIFSINIIKNRFYIEPYWGFGIAYVKYKYNNIENYIYENIEPENPYSQKGFDNYFKFP